MSCRAGRDVTAEHRVAKLAEERLIADERSRLQDGVAEAALFELVRGLDRHRAPTGVDRRQKGLFSGRLEPFPQPGGRPEMLFDRPLLRVRYEHRRVTPAPAASSTMCCSVGLSRTGSSSFGNGFRRRKHAGPNPAAGITVVVTFMRRLA
jgi:hypothetical protein